MKKYILIIAVVFVSCNANKTNNAPPSWTQQNIDSIPACKILLCDNVKLIKVGNSYTATYLFEDTKVVYYKVDKSTTGNDFGFFKWGVKYFDDSCKLKEDLRYFMKLQMVKYVTDHFAADHLK